MYTTTPCGHITKSKLWELHGLSHVLVKGFIDGRQLWGKNLFYGLSVSSVHNAQKQSCFATVAMMKVNETVNESLLAEIDQEIHFNDYLDFLHGKPLEFVIADETVSLPIRTCCCVDWMQAVPLCSDCAAPNASRKHINIQDKHLVYDPLHSFANVVLNLLASCVLWLKAVGCTGVATQLISCVVQVAPKWPDKTFQANKAKKLIDGQYLTDICFIKNAKVEVELEQCFPLAWKPNVTEVKTLKEILTSLLSVLQFAYDWLHCEKLTPEVHSQWEEAREKMLALCALFGNQLNPTIHYWCEHSWWDAVLYGPPSILKQELGEAINKWHKHLKQTCCKGRLSSSDAQNSWECLMNQMAALLSLAHFLQKEV